MSIVKNEPKYKNGILQAIRAQLEHRAHWLYLLCDEAGKRGLDWKWAVLLSAAAACPRAQSWSKRAAPTA